MLFLSHVFCFFFGGNHFGLRHQNLRLLYRKSLLRRNHFIGKGNLANSVIIGDYCLIESCRFIFSGCNNSIVVEDDCHLDKTEFIVEGDNNLIRVGKGTRTHAFSRFSAIDGTKIIIGKNCALGADINARTGDGHDIFDSYENKINPSQDIVIGNHVWIGYHVILLKGASVPDESIVGSGSVVTASISRSVPPPTHSVFAGSPARVVKTGITWDH